MDKQLQQRLLGAAVIVALVVLFVPELVKSPGDGRDPAGPDRGEILPALPERTATPVDEGLIITLPPSRGLSDETTVTDELAGSEPLEPVPDEPEPIPDVATPEPISEPEDELPVQQEPVAAVPPPPAPEPPPPAPRAVEPPPRTAPPPARRPEPPPARTARATPPPAPDVEPVLPELRLIARPMEQYQAQAGQALAGQARTDQTGSGQSDQPRWMVQAGSFEAADNAHQLRDRLRAQQFPATLTQATVSGRLLYRVQIGPHSSRAESERVRDRLRHETGIDASLIPVYN